MQEDPYCLGLQAHRGRRPPPLAACSRTKAQLQRIRLCLGNAGVRTRSTPNQMPRLHPRRRSRNPTPPKPSLPRFLQRAPYPPHRKHSWRWWYYLARRLLQSWKKTRFSNLRLINQSCKGQTSFFIRKFRTSSRSQSPRVLSNPDYHFTEAPAHNKKAVNHRHNFSSAITTSITLISPSKTNHLQTHHPLI